MPRAPIPKAALAWAWLAREQAYIHFGDDLVTVRRGDAHAALARALALQPDLAEAQVAKGFYLYYGERDYPAALHELERVHAMWPNNAEALEALALIQRRLGKWKESTADLVQLVELDPLVARRRIELAGVLLSQPGLRGRDPRARRRTPRFGPTTAGFWQWRPVSIRRWDSWIKRALF